MNKSKNLNSNSTKSKERSQNRLKLVINQNATNVGQKFKSRKHELSNLGSDNNSPLARIHTSSNLKQIFTSNENEKDNFNKVEIDLFNKTMIFDKSVKLLIQYHET